MSYVVAAPEYVASAAADLANIGTALGDASTFAAAPTAGALIPAGADAVSMEVAALFGAHAQAFQEISAQAALFHNQFVQLMTTGGQQYALSEAANVSSVLPGMTNMSQQSIGPSVLSEGAHAAPAVAVAAAQTVAVISPAAGPVVSATTSTLPAGSVGSAVAAGSVGSVTSQPIPSRLAGTTETIELAEPAPVSALPTPLAARAVPAAALSPETRVAPTQQAGPAQG